MTTEQQNQPKPTYKPGDKVRIKSYEWYTKNAEGSWIVKCDGLDGDFSWLMANYCGRVMTIAERKSHNQYTMEEGEKFWWPDWSFDPVAPKDPKDPTDPKAPKDPAVTPTPVATLDLAKILAGHERETFYSILEGDIRIKSITPAWIETYTNQISYTNTGTLGYAGGLCVLFPSRDLYLKYPADPAKAWDEWQKGQKTDRWRAAADGKFYAVRHDGKVFEQIEDGSEWCSLFWEAGDYFPTRGLAEEFALALRKCFTDFHKAHPSI